MSQGREIYLTPAEAQQAASMASVLVLNFVPAVLIWCEASDDLPAQEFELSAQIVVC